MSFPDVPFKATLKPGAKAYSPDGLRQWGNPVTNDDGTVIVIAFINGMARIDSPRWPVSLKRWAVEIGYIVPVTSTPPPPPPPPIEEPVLVATIQTYSNGHITINGNPFPL
jgi:hypothetical protein